jgi:N-methylhydantoinase B
MRMWMTYPMTIIDTIFKALAPAIPEHIIAGHHADLVVGRVNGRRPKDDSFYIYLGGLIGGGWGAKRNSDGCNATIAMNDGDRVSRHVISCRLASSYPSRKPLCLAGFLLFWW